MFHSFGRVVGFLFLALIVLVAMAVGWSMIAAGRTESTLAAAPVTPLSELASMAGTGTRVRVEATAVGEPSLTAPSGEELALQYVRIQHTEGSGDDEETVVDYEYVAPVELVVSDGAEFVRVRAAGVDPRFLVKQTDARLNRDGALPPEVAAQLDPIFSDVPAVPGGEITVWTIAKDAPVTIYGTVVMDQGMPVLQAADDGVFFVVSPLPIEQIVAQAATSSKINAVFGWLLLIVPPAVALWLVWRAARSRRHAPAMREAPAV